MIDVCDRIELNGMKVYPFRSSKELLAYVDCHKGILVAVNSEKVTKATDETRKVVNDNIGYADGAGVVVAMRELTSMLLCLYDTRSAERLHFRRKITEPLHCQTKNGGYRNGYINTEDERETLIQEVAEKKPDVVYVAMGSPKQEFLMADMMKRHTAIYQGLGGSFDVYTGRVKRAPLWWQKHNVEFLFRFLKQPQRYRREYYRLKFLVWMLMGKFKVSNARNKSNS